MSEMSGKGYRNVRRDAAKKQVEAEAVAPPSSVTMSSREHMGYRSKADGEFRLLPAIRLRLAESRKLGEKRAAARRAERRAAVR